MAKKFDRAERSLAHVVARAERAAALAANVATAEAARMGALGDSRQAIHQATTVETALASWLPALFQVYTDERSRLLRDNTQLRTLVRSAITVMFDRVDRLGPDQKALWGTSIELYRGEMAEARDRALAQAEEHFRRPGLRPWWERFAWAWFLVGLVAGKVLDVITRLVLKSG